MIYLAWQDVDRSIDHIVLLNVLVFLRVTIESTETLSTVFFYFSEKSALITVWIKAGE